MNAVFLRWALFACSSVITQTSFLLSAAVLPGAPDTTPPAILVVAKLGGVVEHDVDGKAPRRYESLDGEEGDDSDEKLEHKTVKIDAVDFVKMLQDFFESKDLANYEKSVAIRIAQYRQAVEFLNLILKESQAIIHAMEIVTADRNENYKKYKKGMRELKAAQGNLSATKHAQMLLREAARPIIFDHSANFFIQLYFYYFHKAFIAPEPGKENLIARDIENVLGGVFSNVHEDKEIRSLLYRIKFQLVQQKVRIETPAIPDPVEWYDCFLCCCCAKSIKPPIIEEVIYIFPEMTYVERDTQIQPTASTYDSKGIWRIGTKIYEQSAFRTINDFKTRGLLAQDDEVGTKKRGASAFALPLIIKHGKHRRAFSSKDGSPVRVDVDDIATGMRDLVVHDVLD